MKKTVALILCLVMALSMAACDELEAIKEIELPEPPTAKETEVPEENIELPAETETPEAEAAAEKIPDDEPQSVRPENPVIIKNEKTVYKDYDPAAGEQLILTFSYDTPRVYIEGRNDAAAKINETIGVYNETYYSGSGYEEYDSSSPEGYNIMLQEAQDNFAYAAETGEAVALEFSSVRTAAVERADSNVFSTVFSTYVYRGGAYPTDSREAFVFDTENGGRLSIAQLSTDYDALTAFLVQYMAEKAESDTSISERIAFYTPEQYSEAFGNLLRDGSWYFNNEGMVIFSAPEELGPHAAGTVEFTVPYGELQGKIDRRFIPAEKPGMGEFKIMAMSEVPEGTVEITDRLDALKEGCVGTEICLKAVGNVYDVEIVSVDYADVLYELDTLWYCSEMGGNALQLFTEVPEGFPNLMLKYRLGDGTEQRKLISQSGLDGSFIFVEADVQAVG